MTSFSRTARGLTLAIASLLAVAACDSGREAVPPDADVPAAQEPPPIAESGRKLPEIGDNPRQPVNIDSGTTLTQRFAAPPASVFSQIGVIVGTYGGDSDGRLVLELCQGERCARGETELSAVADNTFAMTQLDSPLEITGDQPISIAISTRDASRPVAIWAYDVPPTVETSVEREDGTGLPVPLEDTSFLFRYF